MGKLRFLARRDAPLLGPAAPRCRSSSLNWRISQADRLCLLREREDDRGGRSYENRGMCAVRRRELPDEDGTQNENAEATENQCQRPQQPLNGPKVQHWN